MEKSGEYSVKQNHDYLKQRKQVLQNSPECFRPTNQVKQFLENQNNKTITINNAIEFYIESRDVDNLLTKLCLRFPFNWRRVNRRNGQFIKQKLNNSRPEE